MNKTPEVKMAEVAKDIEYIRKDLQEIKESVKGLIGIYVTKTEIEEVEKAITLRLLALEKSSNLWKFLSPTFAATSGSVLTFLIIHYITNLK